MPATFRLAAPSNPLMKHAARLLLLPLHLAALSASTLLPMASLRAQMHRVDRPESVTRAVAVYEYVGDPAKPTAARLIPVSLFYGGHFEDAGTYLARPVPLALQTDTAYELQTSGVRTGQLDLAFARNFRQNTADATSAFDDGWFGYGKIQPPRAKPAAAQPKPSGKSTGHAYEVQDDGKPHFGSKPDAADKTTASNRAPDPDPADTERTTRISLPDDTRDPKAPDPDRPTLKRSTTDTNGGPKQKRQKETSSVSATPPDPDKDPDRPSLKRKGAGETGNDIPPDPSELASKSTAKGAGGTVTGAQPMIDDANRPGLHRGKPTAPPVADTLATVDVPKFNGRIPLSDLKQTVAVSDMREIAPHDFNYHFSNDADHAAVLHGMEALATAVLANPALATDAPDFVKNAKPGADHTANAGPSFQPSPRTGMNRAKAGTATDQATPNPVKKLPANATPAQRAAARRTAAAVRQASATATDATTLTDEHLAAYQLSYGAPVTYIFTARTTDNTAPVHYVTVVAQPDPDGNGKLQIGLRSTTDSAHLDRTPRYRLVDAVDADGSNRASLLFEVRNSNSRQFALFRLLGPHPDAVFETGSTK